MDSAQQLLVAKEQASEALSAEKSKVEYRNTILEKENERLTVENDRIRRNVQETYGALAGETRESRRVQETLTREHEVVRDISIALGRMRERFSETGSARGLLA